MKTNTFIIDHETRNVNLTIRALGKLKTTQACQFSGQYHQDPDYCQVYVETVLTEEQLDHWLWSTKSVGDYVGVCDTENRDVVGTELFTPNEY